MKNSQFFEKIKLERSYNRGNRTRKRDIIFSIKNELRVDNEKSLFLISDLKELEENQMPSIENQEQKLNKIKKQKALGSVNLRADVETEKYRDEIKKMEDDRADLYSAIVKLKSKY